jgi:cold-inducible RNA-binding protein
MFAQFLGHRSAVPCKCLNASYDGSSLTFSAREAAVLSLLGSRTSMQRQRCGARGHFSRGSIQSRRFVGWSLSRAVVANREPSPMGNRLYVGNLSFNSTAETLRSSFARFGEVTDVHLVADRETGNPRGFGFVTMNSAEAASDAIAQMNGAMVDGRMLKVNEAEERSRGGGGPRGSGGRSRSRW